MKKLQQRAWKVLPSAANFVFASPADGNAAAIFRHLSDKGVLVRHWNKPRLDQWMRISIGTDNEMQQFFSAIDSHEGAG